MDCSPASLLAAAAEFRALSIRLLRAIITSEWGSYDSFDPAPCAVAIENGGGDLFDCYEDGDASNLPLAGTGMDGPWFIAESTYLNPFGDNFNAYADGVAQESTLVGGSGFSEGWKLS